MVEQQRDENMEEMWDEYFSDRGTEAKNRILTHYLYLVVSVVKRMMPQYQEYCDKDDLISTGILGLIDAVEKFDRSFNVKFQTYASIRIRGEIIDYLRKQDWASTGLRRKITGIQRTSEVLETELHRLPTDREIAARMDISEQEVASALQKSQMFNVINFEAMLLEKESTEDRSVQQRDPYHIVENRELNQVLRSAIRELPEKERMVIVLHYYEGLTMKNIAKVLGVSESRVSQIHSKTLMKMKQVMERT